MLLLLFCVLLIVFLPSHLIGASGLVPTFEYAMRVAYRSVDADFCLDVCVYDTRREAPSPELHTYSTAIAYQVQVYIYYMA